MRFFTLFFVFAMVLAAGTASAETRFFTALNDIPLMPGLYELPEGDLAFDKPEGRIVQVKAVTETKSINEIKGFYDGVLPQLGWARASENQYVRGQEALSLSLETRNGINVLSIHLSPGTQVQIPEKHQ